MRRRVQAEREPDRLARVREEVGLLPARGDHAGQDRDGRGGAAHVVEPHAAVALAIGPQGPDCATDEANPVGFPDCLGDWRLCPANPHYAVGPPPEQYLQIRLREQEFRPGDNEIELTFFGNLPQGKPIVLTEVQLGVSYQRIRRGP